MNAPYDFEKGDIDKIRDILMQADAVTCDIESYEPTYYGDNAVYHIPRGYYVQIDFNKLAQAVYDAGYRKGETL